ncbi:hypothetical protein Hanom_Chr05g00424441 [Helianthus anomalus]
MICENQRIPDPFKCVIQIRDSVSSRLTKTANNSKAERGTLGDSLRGPKLSSGYGAAIQEGSNFGDQFWGGGTDLGRREKVGHPFFQPMKTFLFFF